MDYLIICLVTLVISTVTLLSGFGLGTVLAPVVAIFFPLPLAIASTAVVHLLTNIFQVGLVGKFANQSVVLKFGVPAAIMALIGAYLLNLFANVNAIISYDLHGIKFNITIIGIIVGTVAISFSLSELVPKLAQLSIPPKFIPLGGALSGFFGGLSGNQGMLRSAFLIKSGLDKEQFIGTSVLCSIIVDVARILVYGFSAYKGQFGDLQGIITLVAAASLTAFLGSYIGSKLMHKVTLKTVQIIVRSMIFLLGFALILGIGKK